MSPWCLSNCLPLQTSASLLSAFFLSLSLSFLRKYTPVDEVRLVVMKYLYMGVPAAATAATDVHAVPLREHIW